MKTRPGALFNLLASGVVLTLASLSVSLSMAAPPAGGAGPDWSDYFGTPDGWRHSTLAQINRTNVRKLKVAWIHQAGDLTGGMQTTPIVIDGIIYTISANNRVQAVDGKTGQELWRYEPRLDKFSQKVYYGWFNRGVTVSHGKVVLATADGRGIALDMKTGKEAWQVQLTDLRACQGCNFDSPPVAAGEVLTFGPTGGDLGQPGKIYGVSALTGKLLWTFDTIRNDEKSWPGESGKKGGGGSWLPGTYDAATNTVFYGIANPAAVYNGEERRGDNLYTASVVALDASTGQLRWHHQEVPHDVWDWDSIYEPLLIERDGRKLVVHLNKGGFVTVLERDTGKVVNVWPIVGDINWVKGVNPKTGELIGRNEVAIGSEKLICPALTGARNWNHGAYNPTTGLWYNNLLDICAKVTLGPATDTLQGGYGSVKGFELMKKPGKAPGVLEAADPVTGKVKWRREFDTPHLSSLLSTGGGLLFDLDPFGQVTAYDTDTGRTLWSFNTGSGGRGGIVSYAIQGKQYLLVPSGWGGWFGIIGQQLFPELAKINGAAALIAFTLE